MGENNYITREEFDNYKREMENKVEKLHSENQQILIEVAKIGERIGNFNEKFTDMKVSIDEKLDSFKGDIQVIQSEFMNNLKEPNARLANLKWTIIATLCTSIVGAVLALVIKG